MKNIKTKLALMAIGMILVTGYVSAGDWVAGLTEVNTYTYTPTPGSDATEGGEITNLDIDQETQTSKWAAYYGTLAGSISLRNTGGTFSVFNWAWTTDDAEVCAVSTASDFDWSSVDDTATKGDVDTIWDFETVEADSATNTFDALTEVFDIAGSGTLTAPSFATGPDSDGKDTFETGLLEDTNNVAKKDYAFCVNTQAASTDSCTSAGGCAYDKTAANYELMVPTNDKAGETETYYFYVELN